MTTVTCGLLGVAVSLTLAGSVYAADMPVKAKPLARSCWAGEFHGFYAGAHLGLGQYRAARADIDGFLTAPILAPATYIANGHDIVGGLHVGYNVQCGNWLWGVEADWTFGNLHNRSAIFVNDFFPPGSDISVRSRIDGFGTLRTRGGMVVDNLLVYATGGLAYAEIATNYRAFVDGLVDFDLPSREKRVGWTAGFGAEYAIRPGVHLRAEALYLNFGDRLRALPVEGAPVSAQFRHTDSIWTARVGATAMLDPHRNRNATDVVRDSFASANVGAGRFAGVYVGGHVGFAATTSSPTDSDTFLGVSPMTLVRTNTGFVGGLQAGASMQRGRAVLGVEADWSFGNVTTDLSVFPQVAGIDLRVRTELEGFGTLRGRAGIAADDLLIYVTGGLALAVTRSTWHFIVPGVTDVATYSDLRWGWTAGFAAEVAATDRISIKGEVLYVGLTDTTRTLSDTGFGAFQLTNSDSFWTARLGANVKIGPAADAPARAAWASCGTGRFQGLYVGGHGSRQVHEAARSDVDAYIGGNLSAASYVSTGTEYTGGMQAGYNVQCGNKVFGIEGDWSFGNVEQHTAVLPVLQFLGLTQTIDTRFKDFSTLRGRAGVAIDNGLLYVTAGAAYANIQTAWSIADPAVTETLVFQDGRFGWTAGIGTEWFVLPGVSLKSEVLYADFGQVKRSAFSALLGDTVNFVHSDTVWTSRFGVNVKLQ